MEPITKIKLENLSIEKGEISTIKRVSSVDDALASPPSSSSFSSQKSHPLAEPLFSRQIPPKIFVLHGWAYTTEKWPPFVKELESLGFQVVFLHIPGLTAPLEKAWGIDDYVSWLNDTLKNEVGQVTLLGHSNGGRISLAYTLKYPDKVKQLILIGSAGVYHNDPMIKFKRTFFGALAKLGKSLDGLPYIRRAFYSFVGERDYRDASPIMQETMSNLIKVDLVPKLQQITCPTLLVWGEHDQSTPLSDGKLMNEKILNSELNVVKGARHSPHFTHVSETISVIKKYYEKHI